jgi:hypothetical protein
MRSIIPPSVEDTVGRPIPSQNFTAAPDDGKNNNSASYGYGGDL